MARSFRRVLFLGIAAAMLFSGVYRLADSSTGARAAGVGGPVILGGDDLTDHGGVDGGGNALEGWLYIQRAIENIGPNVTRAGNDGSIAALGSAAGSIETGGDDAGAAIDLAGLKTSRTVTHYEGGAAIDAFFASLAASTTHPAIIHLAGTGAGNDFDDSDGPTPGDGLGGTGEEAAVTAHAAEIAAFVSSGGGLLSHGTYYGWLTALLPGASTVNDGGGGLYFTADGLTDLPSLTEPDINAGPWHNHFEGDLGGLKVLVRSSEVLDNNDDDAAVIIGGAQVTFAEQPDPTATGTPAERKIRTHTPTSTATAAATSTPTPASATNTPAPPEATPDRSSDRAGLILGPNTGSGPGDGSGQLMYWFGAFALAMLGSCVAAAAHRARKE